jgi:hypothetical protein
MIDIFSDQKFMTAKSTIHIISAKKVNKFEQKQ